MNYNIIIIKSNYYYNMPFRLDFFKEGHEGKKFPHYMLFNMTKKTYAKKHFKTKEGAINFAKNAIKFREKKDSRITMKGNRTFILPKT
jgi:GT2 family glycosyltransferase